MPPSKPELAPEPPQDAPRVHQAPKRSAFGSLLSRTLPQYSGPFPVGVCDVEIPVEPQTFGSFRHKSMPDAPAGLALETVMFTLFYPAEAPKHPVPAVWFPKLRQTIDGFLKMAKRTPNIWYKMVGYPVAAAAIYGSTFPATKDAPLASPPPEIGKWPLMLFSHGVGCSRLMYSAFCGEMASRGYVVACVEHRDGTSPSSTVVAEDGSKKRFDWLEWSDLEWPEIPKDKQPTDDTTLRHEQIKFRVAEFEAVVDTMNKLARGEKLNWYSITAPDFDWSRFKMVDPSRPVGAGHSLGGSAVLAASSANKIPFSCIIAFDPAVQRLAPWKAPLPHPLLVVNSEEFVVGEEYRIFSGQMAGTTEDSLQVFSIGGATHPSFSDVFLILPDYINRLTGLKVSADKVIQRTVGAVEDFLGLHPSHTTKLDADNRSFDDGEHATRTMATGGGVPSADAAGVISPTMEEIGATGPGEGKKGEGQGAGAARKAGVGKVRYDRVYETAGREEKAGEKLSRPIAKPGELVKHPLPASS
ncbi:hypothetical protein PUNSTDRAFT_54174 [Punctularia strigosozonata HHB-11173 SS5]|uniref:uncharacterized protein n=1 Tax=Punctularia strigosozonata (strain HHB-11173) TaxID=741275 RepID=UPI0004416D3A|nr:uncharacterized protein PUNSTDRAFT_54174 [Punctularia strigosozonata HHB-11173 SS5]EIN06804.1 hypothetical protein PUNSTDRAFT_54174 [Punctularia strigosozonata HHB-11173 SS5]